MGAAGLRIEVLRGREIATRLDDVARLRIEVFRAFPYLYDGDAAYEARYLQVYADSADSVLVLAHEGSGVVGASTGLPLSDEDEAFHAPFLACGLDVGRVFYCGESVLLPPWRGRGLGHRFFDERERHARSLGRFDWTAFASVERAPDDPRRPDGHRDNDAFWSGRGYVRQSDMTLPLAWKEIGEPAESIKTLTFWLRRLGDAP